MAATVVLTGNKSPIVFANGFKITTHGEGLLMIQDSRQVIGEFASGVWSYAYLNDEAVGGESAQASPVVA